ncbi:MAG: hypothetical protein FWF10_01765 [Clostridiales bacterium]|nr:hypothetical protein [Clostridiales bacterium]
MPYTPTGLQALFPVYLERDKGEGTLRDSVNGRIAQNENNINQNFETLFYKILELESALAVNT